MYLVQQFCDGELWQSEALAVFIASSYSSLKFFFVAEKKQKELRRFAESAINELNGQKWAIKIMDGLTDDRPLTGGGKTTFGLINNYLPILMGHYVNRRLTCSGKTGPKAGYW